MKRRVWRKRNDSKKDEDENRKLSVKRKTVEITTDMGDKNGHEPGANVKRKKMKKIKR